MTAAEPVRRRRRRGRTTVISVVGTTAVVVGAAAWAAIGFGGTPETGNAASTLPPQTATVTKQTLRDAQSESGTLAFGTERSLYSRLGGTVTALAAPGATVGRGGTLYRLDNAPVVLMYGSVPAYRPLAQGVEGPDVAELERNLKAMGYSGFTVDDEYTGDTADAVREWQEDSGLPETGVVDLGRVVFAPGQLRIGAQKVALADAVQPGTAVLTYTGTSRVVTVELDVNDQRLAKEGAAVTVTLPDGSRVAGKISDTVTVIDSSQAPDGDTEVTTQIEVTIALTDKKAIAGYDRASVDVGFVASERKDVLTVPVAALLALGEGGYGLQVVEGGTTTIVAVEVGLFADGRVEVSGPDIAEGMAVGMPS